MDCDNFSPLPVGNSMKAVVVDRMLLRVPFEFRWWLGTAVWWLGHHTCDSVFMSSIAGRRTIGRLVLWVVYH